MSAHPYRLTTRWAGLSASAARRWTLALLTLSLLACGGAGDDGGPETGVDAVNATPGVAPPARSSGYDRSSFVLCDAFEPRHYEEFATIVGFGAEESGAQGSFQCIVKGDRVAFARVQLQPALAPSAEAVAKRSYDGEASPAPEMGEGAWYVDDSLQPHVIFPMGGLILDVNAENESTPDREAMIELALRVREILREANG